MLPTLRVDKSDLFDLAVYLHQQTMAVRARFFPGLTGVTTTAEVEKLVDVCGDVALAALDHGKIHKNAALIRLLGTGTPDGQIRLIGLTKWADCGFPQVELTHRAASALMVSTFTDEVLAQMEMPWPAFMIEVPSDLLFIDVTEPPGGGVSARAPISRVLVTHLEKHVHGKWSFVAMCNSSPYAIWTFGTTPSEMGRSSRSEKNMRIFSGEGLYSEDELFDLSSLDKRTGILVERLILGVCAGLTMEGMRKEVGDGHKIFSRGGAAALAKAGAVRRYRVGQSITVDFRDRINEYMAGKRSGGKKLEVRSMVRGHWKNQHYGVENKEVKLIFLEPYWRGPVAAPINVRAHVIK